MGELAIAPRDLAEHYKTARARLMGAPKHAPAPKRSEPHPLLLIELSRLRQETKIFRDYLKERGVDVEAVINRRPTPSTDGLHKLTVRQIVAAVCDRFMVSTADLHSMRRTRFVTTPRQVAFYLARNLTGRTLPEIGRMIGDRDHTTVLHGWRRISNLLPVNAALAYDVAQIHLDLGIEGRQ